MMGLWLVALLCLFFLTGSIIALFFHSVRPEAKWAASASASGLIVSFLLLGLSSDREDQQGREFGSLIRADRRSAEQAGVTEASVCEHSKAEVAAAKAEEAEAKRQAEAAKAEEAEARRQAEAAKAEEAEARRQAEAAKAQEAEARRQAEAAKAEEAEARRQAEAVSRKSTTTRTIIIRGGRRATQGDQF
jgi:hypothetical protein